MLCHLDRPAVPEAGGAPPVSGAWQIELDLDDDQADGLSCIRCGRSEGAMVPVGWADRPPEVLRRLGVDPGSIRCQIFAHDECELAPPTGTADDGAAR